MEVYTMKKFLALLLAAMMAAAVVPALAEETETVAVDATVAALDNQKLDASYTLALNAIVAEDYEAAKEYISICFAYCDRQSNPTIFADLLLKRGCIDMIEEKEDMALLNLDAALRVDPNLADAYLVKTQIYANAGEVDQAITCLEKYIDLSKDTNLYETVAKLQEAKGDIEAASAAYNKFVEGGGAEAEEAGFQNGVYMMQAGKYADAITAFEAYAENETYGAGAMYNIGVCKMNSGDFEGAVEAFTACENKGGTFEGLYYNRGVCLYSLGRWEDAESDFIKSVETESFKDEALYFQASCRMWQEDYEGAAAMFTEYIGDGEEAAETPAEGETERVVYDGAYYFRGICEGVLGNLEGALADYTKCIENGYELSESYYQRAQVYAALGETEKQNEDLANSLKSVSK